jgi:uncharacterized protein YdhG (YjbR/CyaY superfamily)
MKNLKPKGSPAKKAVRNPKRSQPKTVDEYFANVPEPARDALSEMRVAIASVLPKDTTQVISYGIPAFKDKKVIVWFAAFANHVSLFPTAAVLEQFGNELKGYSTSKGTVHFPLDRRLPVALIRKIVKARMAQMD